MNSDQSVYVVIRQRAMELEVAVHSSARAAIDDAQYKVNTAQDAMTEQLLSPSQRERGWLFYAEGDAAAAFVHVEEQRVRPPRSEEGSSSRHERDVAAAVVRGLSSFR